VLQQEEKNYQMFMRNNGGMVYIYVLYFL